jgi:cell division protein FtsZ
MQSMLEHGYSYILPEDNQPIIKVIGVGGAGGNAVAHMDRLKIKDVDFAVCNTDKQALLASPIRTKLQLGPGLGAGTDAKEGERAALESEEDLRNLLGPPTKMVFITAGMGGGTGTGAAPVLARLARELDLLTVAVVTAPNRFEGIDKKRQAAEGIEELKKYCDTVLVVLNDKLHELYKHMKIREAYAQADNVLANAVKSIAEIITTQGAVNADFMDVKKVLENAGQSVMGSAEAQGENRAMEAIQAALNSPLLNDRDIRGAKRILLTIASSSEFEATIDEQNIISEYISEQIGQEPRMSKNGTIFEDDLGPVLRVTVIAAGFETQNDFGHLLGATPPNEPKPAQKPETQQPDPTPTDNRIADVVDETPEPEPAPTPASNVVMEREAEPEPTPTSPAVLTFEAASNNRDWHSGPSDVLIEMDRPEDKVRIQQMVARFERSDYVGLDAPAYARHKVMLYEMPLQPDHDFERYSLHEQS